MPILVSLPMRQLVVLLLFVWPSVALAQERSRNIESFLRFDVQGGVASLHVEQDRPIVWVARNLGGIGGFVITPREQPEEAGSLRASNIRDIDLLKDDGRYFLVAALESPALRFWDITDPGDADLVANLRREVEYQALFTYKHSGGQALLVATNGGPVEVFDLESILDGDEEPLMVMDTPEDLPAPTSGFDSAFAGYEPISQQDRLYLAGAGGYYVYDITDLSAVGEPLTHISSAAVQRGRMIVPLPDASRALTLAEYRTAPIRTFALDAPRVRTADGAWMGDWEEEYASVQVRWPYAFVAAYEAGLYVINIFDPANPYTDAYYRTTQHVNGPPLDRGPIGAWQVDVRNSDGLIFVNDSQTGWWALQLEAFSSWHGHQWGLPNMSNAQDWDNGPDRQ